MAWYEGQQCAICGKRFGKLRWWQEKPVLVDDNGRSPEIDGLADGQIAELLRRHKVVCWGCSLTYKFTLGKA